MKILDDDHGVLVGFHDSQAMAQAINALLSDDGERSALAAMTAATHPATVDLSALPPYALALKERIAYLPDAQLERVFVAFPLGAQAHSGKERKHGDPYIPHPLAVAVTLADLGLHTAPFPSALLPHPLSDHTPPPPHR